MFQKLGLVLELQHIKYVNCNYSIMYGSSMEDILVYGVVPKKGKVESKIEIKYENGTTFWE